MSSDVGNQEADVLIIDRNKFIKVAGDGGHRLVGNRNPDVTDLGKAGGENRRRR